MAFKKPSSLVSFLNRWNFDVFTWKVYIGDVVENAVDWALSWINTTYNWATSAYNWARDAWDRAGRFWNDLTTWVNQELAPIWNRLQTWWSDLYEWWSGWLSYIKDLINHAREYALDRIKDLLSYVNKWVTAWDAFRIGVLPGLARTIDIRDAINSFQNSWRDLFTFWANWRDQVINFFQDPLQWLYDRLEDFFERFW